MAVAHIERQFHTGESQGLTVDIQFPEVERIRQLHSRREADDVLTAVADARRHLHLQLVMIQFLGVQQEVGILHDVKLNGCHRAAQYLDA